MSYKWYWMNDNGWTVDCGTNERLAWPAWPLAASSCLACHEHRWRAEREALVGTPDTGDVLRARGVMFQEDLPPSNERPALTYSWRQGRGWELQAPPFSFELPRVGFSSNSQDGHISAVGNYNKSSLLYLKTGQDGRCQTRVRQGFWQVGGIDLVFPPAGWHD